MLKVVLLSPHIGVSWYRALRPATDFESYVMGFHSSRTSPKQCCPRDQNNRYERGYQPSCVPTNARGRLRCGKQWLWFPWERPRRPFGGCSEGAPPPRRCREDRRRLVPTTVPVGALEHPAARGVEGVRVLLVLGARHDHLTRDGPVTRPPEFGPVTMRVRRLRTGGRRTLFG